MIRISLLLPTRGRPALVKRLFASIKDTTYDLAAIEVVLYVDDDDASSHDLTSDAFEVTKIIGPQQSMGKNNHACYLQSRGDVLVLMNDDIVIRTNGWDDKLLQLDAQHKDKIYLAYPNDLFKKAWCSFPILSRNTCALLNNEPYPLIYKGAFIDTHLYDLFQRVLKGGFNRIHYLPDVVFEHLHYRTGKATYDETYQKRSRFADDKYFIDLIENRRLDACLLLNVLCNKADTPLSPIEKKPFESMPLQKALPYLTKAFLFDTQLPLRWRGFLWYWFIGRYLAANGFLRPFVRAG